MHKLHAQRAYEANQRAFWSLFRDHASVIFHEEPDFTWYTTTIPHMLFNRVLAAPGGNQMTPSIVKTIGEIITTYQRMQIPFLWYIGPSTPLTEEICHIAEIHGLIQIESNPVMALDTSSLNFKDDSPIDTSCPSIVPIAISNQTSDSSASSIHDWLSIVELGSSHELLNLWHSWYSSLFGKPQQSLQFYLVKIQEEAVATYSLFFAHGIAFLDHVAVLPRYRRHHIGTSIVKRAVQQAYCRAYHSIMLTSSPMGFPLYHRLGFQVYGTLTVYCWQPEQNQFQPSPYCTHPFR